MTPEPDQGRQPDGWPAELLERIERLIVEWITTTSEHQMTIDGRLRLIEMKIDNLKEMAAMAQSDIDALTAQITQLGQTLSTDVTNIQGELSALEQQVANGQPVDLSGIQAAVAGIAGNVASVPALAPADNPPASN